MDTTLQEVRRGLRQPKLFHLENPLSSRLGNDFFKNLPNQPGVYFFHGAEGQLLYIGQSSDLRSRIGSYRHVTQGKNPARTLRLVHRTTRIEWRLCPTPAEAIELERTLLLEHRPPFNRAGVWLGDPWWLTADIRQGKVCLELKRQASTPSDIGPLPAGFRYILAALVRCLLRLAQPDRLITDFPQGLLSQKSPLSMSLSVPQPEETLKFIRDYAQWEGQSLISVLQLLAPPASLTQQEFWLDQIESLTRYLQSGPRHKASLASIQRPLLASESPAAAPSGEMSGYLPLES